MNAEFARHISKFPERKILVNGDVTDGLSLSRHRDSRMIDLTAHRPAQTNQILEEIATYIGCYKPEQILRIAVDGVDGVGKTTFDNCV